MQEGLEQSWLLECDLCAMPGQQSLALECMQQVASKSALACEALGLVECIVVDDREELVSYHLLKAWQAKETDRF